VIVLEVRDQMGDGAGNPKFSGCFGDEGATQKSLDTMTKRDAVDEFEAVFAVVATSRAARQQLRALIYSLGALRQLLRPKDSEGELGTALFDFFVPLMGSIDNIATAITAAFPVQRASTIDVIRETPRAS
jgi:hypothetical protein